MLDEQMSQNISILPISHKTTGIYCKLHPWGGVRGDWGGGVLAGKLARVWVAERGPPRTEVQPADAAPSTQACSVCHSHPPAETPLTSLKKRGDPVV